METFILILVAVIAIAFVTSIGQRLGVASPLLLVALGLGVGLLPFVPTVRVDPEWILIGVLPPLLYSSAVNLPAIEFRRDFGPIAGLSIVLVVISSLVLGAFFYLAVPEVGFPLGVALGAILSPTDAVATSIVKKLGISPRVVTMLEGESLLNDATALVMLRTAIVAVAGSFSLGGAVGTFVLGVAVAIVIGGIVGMITLRVRGLLHNSAATTAISFTVPFLAYFPTEQLGGSGLVAAVVAGIVTGQGAARWFSPEERMSDTLNWRTVELVLEGGVFLLMGLELRDIVTENLTIHDGLWRGTWLALSALGIIVVVRAAYVAFLVSGQSRRAKRMNRERLEQFTERIEKTAAASTALTDALAASKPEAGQAAPTGPESAKGVKPAAKDQDDEHLRLGDPARSLEIMRKRVARALADLDYYQSSPLGWKHGTIIVWAGMRGVVTLAAAQTLPRDESPSIRSLLVFVAFLVAVISLMLQGFTLPWLVRRLALVDSGAVNEQAVRDEQQRLGVELRKAGFAALAKEGTSLDGKPFDAEAMQRTIERISTPPDEESGTAAKRVFQARLRMIDAMRLHLIELSRDGTFSTAALRHSLAELDADQLSLELRLGEDL